MHTDFYTPTSYTLVLQNDLERNPKLPVVMLLGDSISIGYTPHVKEQLQGIATIVRPVTSSGEIINCGSTAFALSELTGWLCDFSPDIIHFNWGLHDIAYRHPDAQVYGNRDKLRGTISVTIEDYESNLRKIVSQLSATGAQLIWASTTVVPPDEAGRFVGDERRYNDVAQNIMQEFNIPVDDLYDLTAKFSSEAFVLPGDVHYTEEASRIIAVQVAKSIFP